MNPEFWRRKKVLVTGCTGFKGSWLSLWLQSLGAEVTGYSLAPPTEPSLFSLADVERGMCSITGDVRNLDHLQRVLAECRAEIVFHLAAQSLVRCSYADPVGTYATNVLGTAHVLEAVRQTETVVSVVIVTTDKCYENLEDGRAYCETDRLGGFDPYSSSKAAAELVTAAFRNSFFEPLQPGAVTGIASARAGNVIGGGDWAVDRLIPDVMRAVLAGKEVLIRNPNAIRPWQHVLEPLCGYLMLAESLYLHPERFAGSWNFGPDESECLRVAAVLGHLRQIWGPGMNWRIDDDLRHPEAVCLKLNSSKARQMLSWHPRWHLVHALEATIHWYQAHQAQKDMGRFTLDQIQSYQSAFSSPGAHLR